MGMKQNLDDIYRVFLNDEELLRLLHYKPADLRENRPDPLSDELPNILDIEDIDALWSIRDACILRTPKSDDLVDRAICRIYLYAGRRRPTRNYQVAKQAIIVDVLCHEDYERDSRVAWISDRINELLCLEHITGMGEIDYVSGDPRSAPNQYVGYQQVYEIGSTKK